MRTASLPLAVLAGLASCTAIPVPAVADPAPESAATPVAEQQPAADMPPPEAPSVQPALGGLPMIEDARLEQGGWLIGRAPADVDAITIDGEAVEVAPDGYFFLAFDRDALAEPRVIVTYADGPEARLPLTLEGGDWDLQYIDAPYRGSARSDEEFQRRRSGEIAQIVAARAKATDATGWRQQFVWPLQGRISGRFGSQRVYQGKPGPYHGGLDIAAPTGTPFVAPADGTVILAAKSPFTLEGYLLMIDHGAGLNSAFLHCSEILVEEGETVKQGQTIGKVGATGRATGPHLHWGMKWKDARIDPLLLVD